MLGTRGTYCGAGSAEDREPPEPLGGGGGMRGWWDAVGIGAACIDPKLGGCGCTAPEGGTYGASRAAERP